MQTFEVYRKAWNKQQTVLRRALTGGATHRRTIEMFLAQHAALHAMKMAHTEPWSFEDEVFAGLSEAQVRCILANAAHSIAWNIWHLARIEDVTMNVLVAGKAQVLNDVWLARLNIDARDTGNAMSDRDTATLSATIDLKALRAYRIAVGRRTRAIAQKLLPQDLQRPVDPARLKQLVTEGAVIEQAQGLIDYWSRLNIAGLLLMPPTRHCFVHLNESLKLKKRIVGGKNA